LRAQFVGLGLELDVIEYRDVVFEIVDLVDDLVERFDVSVVG